jgi:hypothetical protein
VGRLGQQAGWASRPVGLAGQEGKTGLGRLFCNKTSNFNSNVNFLFEFNQIQKFKYHS